MQRDAARPGRTHCLKTMPSLGLGMRVSFDKQTQFASELVKKLAAEIGHDLADAILTAPQKDEADIQEQRANVALLKERLANIDFRFGQTA